MNSIVYVGMDVHKEQYTLCCYSYETDKVEYKQTIPSDYKLVLKYMEQVRSRYDDNDVKEYIRMRDDQKLYLKKVKQQILAFVLRQGKRFEGGKTYWTIAHLKWLKNLELSALQRETLDEYLLTYEYLTEKINRFDERIEELASAKRYEEKVKHMGCLLGIKTHTALSMIVEVGDFERFEKAPKFASFLCLVPSEDSSDTRVNR